MERGQYLIHMTHLTSKLNERSVGETIDQIASKQHAVHDIGKHGCTTADARR